MGNTVTGSLEQLRHVMNNTDFPQLARQKQNLVNLQARLSGAAPAPRGYDPAPDLLEGLLNFLDALQDAADADGFPAYAHRKQGEITLHELFYDGDSFFFVTVPDGPGVRPVGHWCWSEFDGRGESVSDITAASLQSAYAALGYSTCHQRFLATEYLDQKYGAFDADQEGVYQALQQEFAEEGPDFLSQLPAAKLIRTGQTFRVQAVTEPAPGEPSPPTPT